MNKIVLGLGLGTILGCIDGASAWFYDIPEVRKEIASIVMGSTFKGLLAGVLIGWFAVKKRSLAAGIAVGLLVGFALAYLVAAMPSESGQHYYWEIITPGAITGMIVGYATQKFGRAPTPAAR